MNSSSAGLTSMRFCNPRRSLFLIFCLPAFLVFFFTYTHLTHSLYPVIPGTESVRIPRCNSQVLLSSQRLTAEYEFSLDDLHKQYNFSTESLTDVLVFLHMQKTGGTFFGKNLVNNLMISNPPRCTKNAGMLNCPCLSRDSQRNWLFSRYSVGWRWCGLHADYTELTECLNGGVMDRIEKRRNRRFLFMTVLREPVARYVSEWLHVQRGASWIGATLRCNGKLPNLKDLPFCFSGDSWENVTLEEFMNCHYNLAHNRQARMLANLSLAGCYGNDLMGNPVKRQIILDSAKENLRKMPYFAIMKYSNESQFLFEHTFGMKFVKPFYKQHAKKHLTEDLPELHSDHVQKRLRQLNDLDIQLYKFAEQLLLARYEYAKSSSVKCVE